MHFCDEINALFPFSDDMFETSQIVEHFYRLRKLDKNEDNCAVQDTEEQYVNCLRHLSDRMLANLSLPCLPLPYSYFSLEIPQCEGSSQTFLNIMVCDKHFNAIMMSSRAPQNTLITFRCA